MGFKRVWDSSCPHVWDSWEADGVKWVIRDLRPEDDEEAVKILVDHLCRDEVLCSLSGTSEGVKPSVPAAMNIYCSRYGENIMNDPISVNSIREFWRGYLSQRLSLGCYEEKDGQSKLVALNVCLIICQGEEANDHIEGEAWKNVYGALKVCDDRVDPFKLMGLDKILYALGLVVLRDYRGAKLGARILAAREPLAVHHGVKGTSTVFTGPASQKSAERAGFSTVLTVTLKELAEAGLDYPKDENRCIKVMVKKFNSEKN